MTPQELKFWTLAQRRIANMQPEIQAAVLRAFRIIRESFTDAELARIIEAGDVDLVFREALTESVMDRAFIPLRQRLRQSVERGFRYATPSLPGAGMINGSLAVAFDHLSPFVVQSIRALETKIITGLEDDIRETVRAFVENGIRDGVNPRVVGRQLRTVIGMSPTQEANAVKYAAKLAAQEPPLSASRVEKMVETYRRRATALNAETNARTATLDAYKRGQMLAWKDAQAKGFIPADANLVKSWKGVMDDRERPEHVAMEDETVPIDQPFSNGEMIPGDSTYNCRCIPVVSVAK